MRPFLQIILCLFLIISASLSGQGIRFDNSGCAGDGNNDGIIPRINGSAAVLTVQPCQHVTVSHDIFVKNPSDIEWLDSVSMTLGSCYTNVTNLTRNGVNTSFHAFRLFPPLNPPNSGAWFGTYNLGPNKCNWRFDNYINPLWGDGDETNYSCANSSPQKYTFTFEADISSTCSNNANLNINIYISDDGVGSKGASNAGDDVVTSNQFSIALPPVANAGPNQSICNVANTTLAANNLSVGTGSWTVVSGGGNLISPTNPTSNVSSLAFGPNVLMWTVYSNTCALSSSTVVINRDKIPTPSVAGPSQSVCVNSATLAANVPTDGTGSWSVLSGTGTVTSPILANSTVTGLSGGPNVLQWTITSGACGSSTSTVLISSFSNPIPANAGPNQTNLCGVTSTTLAGSVGTGSWTVISGAGASFVSTTNPTTVFNGILGTSYVLMWTVTNGPCITTSTVNIVFNQNPSTAIAGTNTLLCNTTSYNLSANTPTVGLGFWSVLSGTGIVTTPTLATSSITGLSVGTNTLQWTITSGACGSSTSNVVVTVSSNPTITVNSGTICSGNSFTIIPSGASTYTYSSGSNIITPTITTSYSITGTSAFGCVSSNTAISTVNVILCSPAEAINFDGIDDQIVIPKPISTDFTIEYWMKTTQNGGGSGQWYNGRGIVDADAAIGGATDFGTSLLGSKVAFGIGNPDVTIKSTTNVNTGNWTHVAATWNQTTGEMKLYVNGILESVGTSSTTVPRTIPNRMVVGSRQTNNGFYQGNIDELRLWNTVRTQCEINTYKDCEIPATTTDLVANYHFNQGFDSSPNPTITALIDVSGSANTGTLTNFALTGSTSNWIAPGSVISGYTITTNSIPTVNAIVTNSIICTGNSTILNGLGANTYTWTNGVVNGVAFFPTTTDTYTVIGSAISGCTNTAVATITVNNTPTVSVNTGTICSGNSFTIIPSGANTYTYSSGSNSVAPLTTTSYSVIGESIEGCVSNTAISTVIVNVTPTISVNSGTICSGNSFTIIPSGANTYTYSSGSNNVAPLITTSYSVIGESIEGCVSSNTAISSVTVNTTPTISVNSGFICSGNSFTMIPSGANTYTYSSGSNSVAPLTTTSYSVIGESIEGCVSNTAISTVTVNVTPTISVNSGTICSGNSFTIIPSGANTYTYSSGSNNVVPLTTTSYSVIGESIEGCVSSNTAVSSVTVNTTPTISVNNGSICSGNSFTIIPSGANTYTYSSGSNSVAPLTTTSYSVIGESIQGCVSSNTAISSVTVNVTPTISVNSGSICSGNSFTIIPSGANTYTYSSGSNSVAPLTTTSYSVIGESIQGCVSSNTAVSSVTVNTTPTISVNSGTICSGNSFTIIPSGANTYTYSSGSNSVAPSVTTSYSVTGTSLQGCVSSNTAVSSVAVNNNPTITVNNGTICIGTTFVINPLGAITYTYSSGSNSVSPTTTSVYTVTGSDANTCMNTNTLQVSVDSLPSLSFGGLSQTICSNSIVLGANTPVIGLGSWSVLSGTGVITTPTVSSASITGLSIGANILQWTIINGVCPASTSTVVITQDVNPSAPVIAVTNTIICSDSYTLTGSTPTSGVVNWTVLSGNGIITNSIIANSGITFLSVGTNVFQMTVSNGSVCPSKTATVIVTRDEMPSVAFAGLDFNSDVLTNTLTANTPTIGTGSWNLVLGNASIQDNSQPTTILNSSEAGEFELVWTIKNGVCPPSSDTIVITINPLLIPQIITPNNDGNNDVFEIRALKNTQNIKLTILNRWGNEVYSSSDYKQDFNGKNNSNNTLADDTYYYLIEVGETVYKGYFMIKTN